MCFFADWRRIAISSTGRGGGRSGKRRSLTPGTIRIRKRRSGADGCWTALLWNTEQAVDWVSRSWPWIKPAGLRGRGTIGIAAGQSGSGSPPMGDRRGGAERRRPSELGQKPNRISGRQSIRGRISEKSSPNLPRAAGFSGCSKFQAMPFILVGPARRPPRSLDTQFVVSPVGTVGPTHRDIPKQVTSSPPCARRSHREERPWTATTATNHCSARSRSPSPACRNAAPYSDLLVKGRPPCASRRVWAGRCSR